MTKDLSVCGACGCDPCDCHGVVELIQLTYKVKDRYFKVWVPKRLVDIYRSMYMYIEVMEADGTMVVYNSDVVGGKSNENQ
tara:strand:- start:914 stop:1156 length:243 start_codon:yes stop_codon:yes gene_type:complete